MRFPFDSRSVCCSCMGTGLSIVSVFAALSLVYLAIQNPHRTDATIECVLLILLVLHLAFYGLSVYLFGKNKWETHLFMASAGSWAMILLGFIILAVYLYFHPEYLPS